MSHYLEAEDTEQLQQWVKAIKKRSSAGAARQRQMAVSAENEGTERQITHSCAEPRKVGAHT